MRIKLPLHIWGRPAIKFLSHNASLDERARLTFVNTCASDEMDDTRGLLKSSSALRCRSPWIRKQSTLAMWKSRTPSLRRSVVCSEVRRVLLRPQDGGDHRRPSSSPLIYKRSLLLLSRPSHAVPRAFSSHWGSRCCHGAYHTDVHDWPPSRSFQDSHARSHRGSVQLFSMHFEFL
jgi:hypothetical protein